VDAVRTAGAAAGPGAAAGSSAMVEFIGNYTAFADLLARR
jgi:hypothetical protein